MRTSPRSRHSDTCWQATRRWRRPLPASRMETFSRGRVHCAFRLNFLSYFGAVEGPTLPKRPRPGPVFQQKPCWTIRSPHPGTSFRWGR
jgi:hypothetical protein